MQNKMNAKGNRQAPSKNEQTITSVEIAEISSITHANLMKSIRKQEVAWQKVNGVKFHSVKYKDRKGEERPMYKLTQAECLYISSKFNDETRAKLVMRWVALEQKVQKDLFGKDQGFPPLPPKRQHNRLTPTRLVGIMADIAQIEDKDLRLSLISKLGV